jgi:transcriptional regulator with XRE-family HTH domain
MTDAPDDSIGRRIAKYRRLAGIETAKDLAARIGNEKITASVIQNIESGRKADLSVSQLLNISRAVEVSPVQLLASIDRPFDRLDLVGLSPSMATMTGLELDSWISASDLESTSTLTYHLILQQIARRDLRKLIRWYDEWESFENGFEEMIAEEEMTEIEQEKERAVHKANEKRIGALYARLSEVIDVSWAKGPWSADG